MNNQIKNYGILLGDHINTYRAGAKVGALPYTILNPAGDWESVLPLEERQYNDGGDSMSCVTFAHLNGIETQEKFLTGFYQEYSDRFIAKMSDTTREGNYLWKVAETIRKFGLVKEESYPKPDGSWTWDEYHKDITEPLLSQLKVEGQEWLKKWDVKYESVDFNKESLIKHLKMAPLTIVIPGHAVMNFRTTEQVIFYFDTYPIHKKTISNVIQAMKVTLYPKEQAIPNEYLLVDIKFGDSGRQVEKLINALDKLGWHLSPRRSNIYVYDSQVAELIFQFQRANFPDVWWASFKAWWNPLFWEIIRGKFGNLVGVETRKLINNALSKKLHG